MFSSVPDTTGIRKRWLSAKWKTAVSAAWRMPRKWISLASSAGNCGYTDREESEDEKRKQNVSPFSLHSPTRSLKQDSEACGGGYNLLKLYSSMAFPQDRMQTRDTWTVLPLIFVRFFSFFLVSTMRMSVFCPLNKHFSRHGFELPLISVPYLIRRKRNRFLKWF